MPADFASRERVYPLTGVGESALSEIAHAKIMKRADFRNTDILGHGDQAHRILGPPHTPTRRRHATAQLREVPGDARMQVCHESGTPACL
jgi:hypothetical protein